MISVFSLHRAIFVYNAIQHNRDNYEASGETNLKLKSFIFYIIASEVTVGGRQTF